MIRSEPHRLRVFTLRRLAAVGGRPLSRFRSRVLRPPRSPSLGSPGPNHKRGSLARAAVTFTRSAPSFFPRSPGSPTPTPLRKTARTRHPASPGSLLIRFRVRYTATYVAPATRGRDRGSSLPSPIDAAADNVSAVIRPGSAAAFARVLPRTQPVTARHAACCFLPPPKITPLRGGLGRPSGAISLPGPAGKIPARSVSRRKTELARKVIRREPKTPPRPRSDPGKAPPPHFLLPTGHRVY